MYILITEKDWNGESFISLPFEDGDCCCFHGCPEVHFFWTNMWLKGPNQVFLLFCVNMLTSYVISTIVHIAEKSYGQYFKEGYTLGNLNIWLYEVDTECRTYSRLMWYLIMYIWLFFYLTIHVHRHNLWRNSRWANTWSVHHW